MKAELENRRQVGQTVASFRDRQGMTDHDRVDLARLQADLEQATRDAKELMQRLAADLHERTRQRQTHLLDPSDRRDSRERQR